jgi:hypothetical protein
MGKQKRKSVVNRAASPRSDSLRSQRREKRGISFTGAPQLESRPNRRSKRRQNCALLQGKVRDKKGGEKGHEIRGRTANMHW